MSRSVVILALVASSSLHIGCDDGGSDGDEGDLDYYCEHYSRAYCEAYSECDLFNFHTYFESVEQCAEQTETDCLDPPAGHETCDGATVEETDACVEYVRTNFPDGCENLFGPSKDLSLCEDICS
jgi:hypothetical protein